MSILFLSFFILISIARGNIWRDEVTLWNDSMVKSPMESRPAANMAGGLYREGRFEEAVAEYRKALEKNPDNYPARHGLGLALTQLNRFTEAASEYRKAIRLKDIPGFHVNLAMCLERSGDVRGAAKEIIPLVRRTPDDITMRAYLLTLLDSLGKKKKYLLRLIDKARSSGNPMDLFEAGWACTVLERNQEAEGYLRKTLKTLPDFYAARYYLGIVLGRLGKYDEALEPLEKAMAGPPIFWAGESHYNLGLLYQMIKDAPRAEREYLYALEINPKSSEAHNNLGILYLSLGRRLKALEEFQIAVQIDPKNSEARKNLSLLSQETH